MILTRRIMTDCLMGSLNVQAGGAGINKLVFDSLLTPLHLALSKVRLHNLDYRQCLTKLNFILCIKGKVRHCQEADWGGCWREPGQSGKYYIFVRSSQLSFFLQKWPRLHEWFYFVMPETSFNFWPAVLTRLVSVEQLCTTPLSKRIWTWWR